MPHELIRTCIAILGVCIGAYYDVFNNKNVPELFLYGFLAIAFLTNLIAYDSSLTFYSIAVSAVVFGFFYILYKAGQLGGADVYILASVSLLLPLQPQLSPFLSHSSIPQIPFIASVILVSGISLMLYMVIRSFPIALKFVKAPKNLDKTAMLGSFAMLGAFAIFSFVSVQSGLVPYSYFLLAGALVALSIYFTIFKPAINESMVEWVDHTGVEPEDIIAIDMMDKDLVRERSLSRLVDANMHERMKKIHGKKIAVYRHLPMFIPHLLIGLIFSILIGNLILILAGF